METQIFKTKITTDFKRGLHRSQICAILIFLSVFLWAVPARAEENINVNLRIEAPSQTILNQQISVPYSCEVTDSAGATSTYAGYKAICALQSAQEQGLLTYNVNNFGWGLFIEKINNIGNNANMFWALYQKNNASMVGATDLPLLADDKIVLSYVDWNYSNEILGIALSSSTVYTNSSTTLQAQMWNGSEFSNFNSPVSFFINGTAHNAPSGTLEYTPDTEGQKEIYVEAVGKTRSEKQTINVIPAQIPEPTLNIYHVNVNYLNEEIFNQAVSPTSTWFFDSAGALYSTSTVSALGVLAEASRQGNFPLTIQSGWGSYYVSDIAGHVAQGFDGWVYNINQKDPGSIGMNGYPIKNGELLTVFYSVWPWKIESSTSSVYLGENLTFKALNYASSTWQISPSTTISINSQLFVTDGSGQYVYTPSATGTLSAFIYNIDSPNYPQNSPTISVTVLSTSTPPTDDQPPPDNGGGGCGNNNNEPPVNPIISDADIKTAVDKILAYLKSKQDTNGGIIVGYDINNNPITDAGVTDWAIMSFGANGEYASDIKNGDKSLLDFAKEYNFTDGSEMNKCAGYPRHILALLSAGVEPTDLTILDLKEKINTICHKNNLYGENGINDDVFGLIALLATGVSQDEPIIQDMVKTIRDEQTADGSFTYTDFTGIAINALKFAETKGVIIDPAIYTKAKNYLKPIQLEDGGWGQDLSYPLTTSWVMMGINALGEKQSDWTKENKNPWHVLTNQLVDGRYIVGSAGDTDWFSTKHAVPALLGKSWPIILPPRIAQPEAQPAIGGGGNQPQTTTTTIQTPNSDNQTPTTTPTFTTSTTPTLTSTPEYPSTSVPEHLSTSTETIAVSTTKPVAQTSPISYLPSLQSPTKQPEITTPTNSTSQTISPAPPQTPPEPTNPVSSAAKKLFAGSSIAAGGLGLYLAWRLLQTMI